MSLGLLIIIGLSYYQGWGTPIDMDKALACFVLAAEQKQMNAIYETVVIYKDKMMKI